MLEESMRASSGASSHNRARCAAICFSMCSSDLVAALQSITTPSVCRISFVLDVPGELLPQRFELCQRRKYTLGCNILAGGRESLQSRLVVPGAAHALGIC